MTVAVIALAVLCLVLLSALIAKIAQHEARIDRLLNAHTLERAADREAHDAATGILLDQNSKLADRIQHPEVLHFPSVQSNPSPPPKDPAELAHVGEQVPEFVNVGSTDEMVREEQELAKVGTVDNTDIGEVE